MSNNRLHLKWDSVWIGGRAGRNEKENVILMQYTLNGKNTPWEIETWIRHDVTGGHQLIVTATTLFYTVYGYNTVFCTLKIKNMFDILLIKLFFKCRLVHHRLYLEIWWFGLNWYGKIVLLHLMFFSYFYFIFLHYTVSYIFVLAIDQGKSHLSNETSSCGFLLQVLYGRYQ